MPLVEIPAESSLSLRPSGVRSLWCCEDVDLHVCDVSLELRPSWARIGREFARPRAHRRTVRTSDRPGRVRAVNQSGNIGGSNSSESKGRRASWRFRRSAHG